MSDQTNVNDRAKRIVPGLPDEEFVRGDVPLTKQEIRCMTLSKLKLGEGSRVLDIGAGSGGLTVECALLLGDALVWAVERYPEALKLIRANLERFGVQKVTVIEGEAPAALEDLGQFDRVIIGGSGGNLEDIVVAVHKLLVPGGVVVLNCILLQTLTGALEALEKSGFSEISFIQVAISRSRKMGSGTALQPLNPVFIVSAVKGAV